MKINRDCIKKNIEMVVYLFQVETVGDAYVVVSGCPKKNGIKHASEIASMALELLSHMTVFRVRHLPDHQLQLRIGINTGRISGPLISCSPFHVIIFFLHCFSP